MRQVTSNRLSKPIGFVLIAAIWLLAGEASAIGNRGADGKFEKRTSSHFVVYQDVDIDQSAGLRGSRRFEQELLAVLESAYLELDRLLGLRPESRIEVVVYDPQIFDSQFGGLFRFPAAGFYGGVIRIRGDTVVTNRLVRVLHHELFHAALDAEAPSFAHPAWLNEGLAEWFEARSGGNRYLSSGQRRYLNRMGNAGALFSIYDLSNRSFGHFGPEAAGLAYLQSYGFMEYLARTHGERALREFVRSYVRSGDFDRAFRRTYRADLVTLEERYHVELIGAGR